MNIPLLIETVRHLRLTQVVHQLKHRLVKEKLGAETSPTVSQPVKMLTSPIVKPRCYDGQGRFTFLNIGDTFRGWDMDGHGALWAYNLNYMDWLCQEGITPGECVEWIDRFIDALPSNRVGQDPYPTALRVVNWAKFFCRHPEFRSQRRLDSMYAQTLLLERKLEYHLLGNHLLEDAYALYIAAHFFADRRLLRKAETLLHGQLREQTLADGAHYEQSAMYHCILLDRLLDCINFSGGERWEVGSGRNVLPQSNLPPLTPHPSPPAPNPHPSSPLSAYASLMLGHLASIVYRDGSIPLFNDAALGIAPTPAELFDYARRLGVTFKPLPLRECGYRRLADSRVEVTADVGNIVATYQPGHSHADTFSYELRVDGRPLVVDTGTSTYDKNARRQYERSTSAHNTVTPDTQAPSPNSSHVWGGFRIGRRARVAILKDEPQEVVARHDGYGRNAIHERRFLLADGVFRVEDCLPGAAVSWIHLSSGLRAEIVSEKDGLLRIVSDVSPQVTHLRVEHCQRIELLEDTVSTEYNRLQTSQVVALHFTDRLAYTVG